jgi:serine protease Do
MRSYFGPVRSGRFESSWRPSKHSTVACLLFMGWIASAAVADGQDSLSSGNTDVTSSSQNQSSNTNQSISVRRPIISLDSSLTPSGDEATRQRLFNQLGEEASEFDRLGNLVRRVSTLVKPSVIHIEAHKTESENGRKNSYDEAGSGVIIEAPDATRWVLTNRHVILGASARQILLRDYLGREFYPSKVLADASTDIAMMKIDVQDLPAARVGDSKALEIGDFVIAIGSPFGLSHSVTFGILSAKGRRDLSLGEQKIDLQDFFQTDAAINPGNSGGPLVNLRGEVVAINTAIASSSGGSEGIGFAIPINMAVEVADQLVSHGALRRGYLGVTLDPDFSKADLIRYGVDLSSEPGLQGGALVKDVRVGSPAAQANLQQGDVIVQFDGNPVDNDDHLVAQVGLTRIGAETPMIIYRDGKRYRTSVTLVDLQ